MSCTRFESGTCGDCAGCLTPRILSLTAGNERLKREVAELERIRGNLHHVSGQQQVRIGEAWAERDRYRTALEVVGKPVPVAPGEVALPFLCPSCRRAADFCDRHDGGMLTSPPCPGPVARRALTNTTPPPAAELGFEVDQPRVGPGGQELDVHGRCVKCGSQPRAAGDEPPTCLCPAAAPPVALRPAREAAEQIARDLRAWYRQTGGIGPWFELTDRIMAVVEVDRTQRTCCAKAFAEGRDAALANAAMKAYDMGHPDVRKAINRLMPDDSPAIPIDDERYAGGQPRGEKP